MQANLKTCQDLLPMNFNLVPRLSSMLKYNELAKDLIQFVKNGVMAHVSTKKALQDLFAIQPSLIKNAALKTSLTLEISRGIRTMLCWYREFKKGKRAFLKHASPSEEADKGEL